MELELDLISRASLPLLSLAAVVLASCEDSVVVSNPDPILEPVTPIYDPSRPTHYFDYPFPTDALLTDDGTPDLTVHADTPGIGGDSTTTEVYLTGQFSDGSCFESVAPVEVAGN